MRRVLVVLAAAALLVVALPSVTSAHRSVHESDSQLTVYCDPIQTDDGFLLFYAAISDTYGSDAGLVYWQPPAAPDESPPTWSSWQGTAQLSADGTQLGATLDMYEYVEPEPEPEPEDPVVQAVPPPEPEVFVGVATVALTLEPIGAPEPYSYESSQTNQRYRVEGETQSYAVSGEAVLPGEMSFDLGSCAAYRDTYTFFGTNPDAFVSRSEGAFVACSWEGEGYSIGLGFYRENEFTGADLYIMDLDGEYYGVTESAVMTDAALSAEFDIYQVPDVPPDEMGAYAVGPGELVGEATVWATLDPTGERTRFQQQFGWEKMRSRGERLAVSGELDVAWPGGEVTLALDEASCTAERYRTWQHASTPSATPHVKAVANDLPGDALPIAVGESDVVRNTAGTSAEPEAPCTMIDPELGEPVELPFGYTAWWIVEGTGGEVTVDTAGSGFDTVVAVYVDSGEGLSQVGCVDDVMIDPAHGSLEAAITFATDAGTTYLVQAGGFGYATGRLELAVR
jgi:hypothetical protein